MAYPLFFKMVSKREADRVVMAIQQNLLRGGGIVTTTNKTGLAWDAPYGYAPIQWLTIKGLRNYGHEETANDIKKYINNTIFMRLTLHTRLLTSNTIAQRRIIRLVLR